MANRSRLNRLHIEVPSLSTSLPLTFDSGIYLRVDEDRLDVIKVMIIGSEGTPYENGCFVFDIFVPVQYPQTPPNVQLVTTGNGTVRFNPNLYQYGLFLVCRFVCHLIMIYFFRLQLWEGLLVSSRNVARPWYVFSFFLSLLSFVHLTNQKP